MTIDATHSGWNRVATGLDVEVLHGVPVRVTSNVKKQPLNEDEISEQIRDLTGLNVSMNDWISVSPEEQEWSVCIAKQEFSEVLRRLALSSAAMYVDRFHKAIDHTAVDWNTVEFNYDFNHAIEHCCIPYGTLNKEDYFADYVQVMLEETSRLIDERISPLVEAE